MIQFFHPKLSKNIWFESTQKYNSWRNVKLLDLEAKFIGIEEKISKEKK
jgi:hypothetical protein